MKSYLYLGLGLFFYTNPCFADSNYTDTHLGVGFGSGTTSSALTGKKYIEQDKAIQIFLGTQGVLSVVQFFSLGGDFLLEYTLQEKHYFSIIFH